MRRITEKDLAEIMDSTIQGYQIEDVRTKRGHFTDSDHYGIVLGKNHEEQYVTWQFHLLEDETASIYWEHYFMENREAAVRDFNTRDAQSSKFKVTITETLKMTAEVEAEDQTQAEQTFSDNWKAGAYVLDSNHFFDVEFEAIPVDLK